MINNTYFDWLLSETPTTWWHDSADPEELALGLGRGASGVTTNPLLTALTLQKSSDHWREALATSPSAVRGEMRAEARTRVVVAETAQKVESLFNSTAGRQGYACAQVHPGKAGDREYMLAQAHRLNEWAPNIAVKLPATAAGLDVLEECAAEGISTTITVSFTVAQVVSAAERFHQGRIRARQSGMSESRCFAVLMVGRLDDYIREVAHDRKSAVSEADIRQAGVAVAKRAYRIFKQSDYEAKLLVAALRGIHHMTDLAGADLVMSISPDNQSKLLEPNVPREPRIDSPLATDVLERLERIPEFVKAFEPDGLRPEEFIAYGLTQRTLTQFLESGWKLLEA